MVSLPPFLLRCFCNFRFLVWRVQPRHHCAQFAADVFDLVLGIGLAHGLEAGATGLVLENPARGKGAVLDLLQHLPHFFAYTLIDDARAGDVIAELGGIADGVAHRRPCGSTR